jgi:predicted glycogen debranching enzyme
LIAFGPEVCGDFSKAITYEWLETDGLGGYASSTIVGANTRRYHGLLVAALRPPTERTVILSKLEETLAVRDTEYDLSCNRYPDAVHPRGFRFLREFRLDPFPTFAYEVGNGRVTRLEKTVAMCRGHSLVIVRYRMIGSPGTASLIVRPIVNCRGYHELSRKNSEFDTSAEISGARDLVSMKAYPQAPVLRLRFPGAYFEPWGDWYLNFEYPEEAARGLDYREDQHSSGFFTCDFEPGDTRYLLASTEAIEEVDPAGMMEAERRRRAMLLTGWSTAPEEVRQLVTAADAFVVERPAATGGRSSYGILAGYHWFEEWGRDAMISLPGLTLVTGRHEVARSVLTAFAERSSNGLIPNRIPHTDEKPDYNTVDATLWMFWAVQKYLDYTGDREFVAGRLLPVLLEIIAWHVRGTHYGIAVDEDGLLRAGSPEFQLTWMDAKVGDWVVTPRNGKPVEINALWHNALRFVEELGAEHAGPSAAEVAREFSARFWNDSVGHLNDVVDGSQGDDASLRPNQILAVSLPYPALVGEPAAKVVEVVKRELLTPYGLRTLSPGDSRYHARYEGDQRGRDGAYHQGTVWAWLLGPLITAHMSAADDKAAARREATGWLAQLWRHMREAGLGQISEIFDGDAPHRHRGCIAQAWSVAEILRAAVEDLEIVELAPWRT